MEGESPIVDQIVGLLDLETQRAAQLLLVEAKKSSEKVLRTNRRNMGGFEKRLNQSWGRPFQLLEVFIQLSFESGANFNASVRPEAARNNDMVFEVLCRLHGRACRIAQEMLILMRSGYASGAFSRWRTLHELAVVACFIKLHGRAAAERYLLYDVIESCKAMNEYQAYCRRLGYEPYSEKEIAEAMKAKVELVQKYENEFKNNLGWASKFVGNPKPTLSQLEKAVKLDHLRPYYRMASYDIHAGPKGIMFNLGIPRESSKELIAAGPSNAGMADPGQCAAMSLHQITACLLATYPRIENIIILKALKLLENEVSKEFIQSHRHLEALIRKNPKPTIGIPKKTLLTALDAGDRHHSAKPMRTAGDRMHIRKSP